MYALGPYFGSPKVRFSGFDSEAKLWITGR